MNADLPPPPSAEQQIAAPQAAYVQSVSGSGLGGLVEGRPLVAVTRGRGPGLPRRVADTTGPAMVTQMAASRGSEQALMAFASGDAEPISPPRRGHRRRGSTAGLESVTLDVPERPRSALRASVESVGGRYDVVPDLEIWDNRIEHLRKVLKEGFWFAQRAADQIVQNYIETITEKVRELQDLEGREQEEALVAFDRGVMECVVIDASPEGIIDWENLERGVLYSTTQSFMRLRDFSDITIKGIPLEAHLHLDRWFRDNKKLRRLTLDYEVGPRNGKKMSGVRNVLSGVRNSETIQELDLWLSCGCQDFYQDVMRTFLGSDNLDTLILRGLDCTSFRTLVNAVESICGKNLPKEHDLNKTIKFSRFKGVEEELSVSILNMHLDRLGVKLEWL